MIDKIDKKLNYDRLRILVYNILNGEDNKEILRRCFVASDWILENENISQFQRNLLLDMVVVIYKNYR